MKLLKNFSSLALAGFLSLAPAESFGQKDTKDIKEHFSDSMTKEDYRQAYLDYMKHPSYKKRLRKEMFGDEKFSKESLNKEYNRRLDSVKNLEISLNEPYQRVDLIPGYGRVSSMGTGSYSSAENFLRASPNSMFHELSHAAELCGIEERGNRESSFVKTDSISPCYDSGFHDKKREIYKREVNTDLFGTPRAYQTLDSLIGYKEKIITDSAKDEIRSELYNHLNANRESYLDSNPFKINLGGKVNHYDRYLRSLKNGMQEPIISLNRKLRDTFYRRVLESFKEENLSFREEVSFLDYFSDESFRRYRAELYYNQNTEIKARLNSIRIEAIKNHDYNLGEDFKIGEYPELKESREYMELKGFLKLRDKEINELMEYTADATQIQKSNSLKSA